MFENLESQYDSNDKTSDSVRAAADMFASPPTNRPHQTSIIAVANQKGGCGKTTTTINLSAAMAKTGLNILMIDLDAQSQASLGVGIDVDGLEHSVYDVMVNKLDLQSAIVHTPIQNLDIVPAAPMLTGAQLEMAGQLGREWTLKTAIEKMTNSDPSRYDCILMDCSPSLNLITINALTSAQSVLIPSQTHYFSLEGIRELLSTIDIVKERLNPNLKILGILPTLYDIRTSISRRILAQMRKYFKRTLFQTVIHNNIKLVEAQVRKKSIHEFAPSSSGSRDYLALSREVIARIGTTPPRQDTPQPSDLDRPAQDHALSEA